MSFSYIPISLFGMGAGNGLITVGESGLYSSINEAMDDWHNVLFINSDVTEPSGVSVRPSGLTIVILPSATLDMGTNKFNLNDTSLNITGHGNLSYAFTSAQTLFDGNAASKLSVQGITIQNASTGYDCLTNIPYAKFADVTIEGDATICSSYNTMNGTTFKNGTIGVASGVDSTLIAGSLFDGMLIIDSGNGTVISDGAIV